MCVDIDMSEAVESRGYKEMNVMCNLGGTTTVWYFQAVMVAKEDIVFLSLTGKISMSRLAEAAAVEALSNSVSSDDWLLRHKCFPINSSYRNKSIY